MESPSKSSTILAKSVAMVTLFTISMILGVVPMKLAKKFQWNANAKNNVVVQLLLCVGGGVLMSTTFIHLLPEVSENIEKNDAFSDFKNIPIAETLTCIGFFIIYLVEECVHVYLHRNEHSPDVNIIRRSVSILRGEVFNAEKKESQTIYPIFDQENPARLSKGDQVETQQQHVHEENLEKHKHLHEHNEEEHNHLAVGDENFLGSIRGLLVVLALSVHEILEGLSVGLEKSSSNVWYMFGAVGAHKFIIAFCVGVELLSSGIKNKLIVIYVFTFAVVSPIGIAIGIAISTFDGETNSQVPSIILQGFATGTLLYVVFFEILKKNEREGAGLYKYAAVLFGFILMFFLTEIVTDD